MGGARGASTALPGSQFLLYNIRINTQLKLSDTHANAEGGEMPSGAPGGGVCGGRRKNVILGIDQGLGKRSQTYDPILRQRLS